MRAGLIWFLVLIVLAVLREAVPLWVWGAWFLWAVWLVASTVRRRQRDRATDEQFEFIRDLCGQTDYLYSTAAREAFGGFIPMDDLSQVQADKLIDYLKALNEVPARAWRPG